MEQVLTRLEVYHRKDKTSILVEEMYHTKYMQKILCWKVVCYFWELDLKWNFLFEVVRLDLMWEDFLFEVVKLDLMWDFLFEVEGVNLMWLYSLVEVVCW